MPRHAPFGASARRLAGLLALVSLAVALGSCAGAGATPKPSTSGCVRSPRPVAAPQATPLAQPPRDVATDGTTATIHTRLGDITIELFTRSASVASTNFIDLAEAGFYDCVVFHRLVPGFVIQGGDPNGRGDGGPGYTIQDEPVVGTYARGVVAMARTPRPNSQGSQFFIVLDDAARRSLDAARTYVIFGRVTAGMDVVDRIAAMPTSGDPDNQALQPVAMTSVNVKRP